MIMSRFLPSIGLKPLAAALALGAWLQACTPEDPVNLQTGLSDRSLISQDEKDNPESGIIPGQYIVILKEESLEKPIMKGRAAENLENRQSGSMTEFKIKLEAQQESMKMEMSNVLRDNNISVSSIQKVYSNLTPGATLQLTEVEAMALHRDERVQSVEPDRVIALDATTFIRTPFVPSDIGKGDEIVTYGVTKVGGSRDMSNDPNKPYRWAWILDTGLDMDHPDLDVEQSYSKNFTNDATIDDGNGHGTHVAGIIAAKDNGFGVTGIAAGATVVAIKVLDNQGVGTYSDIVAALDYVWYYSLPGDVVNMSFGGAPSGAVDAAVRQLGVRGLKVVVAAGNSYENVSNVSPARVNEANVYTVASTNYWDYLSYFSNYGSGVDFAAPGSGIISTYKNNGYGMLSGTSMAAPHVTGVMIINPTNYRTVGYSKGNNSYRIIGHSGNTSSSSDDD